MAKFLSVTYLGREVMVHEETGRNPDSGCPGSHFITRANYVGIIAIVERLI